MSIFASSTPRSGGSLLTNIVSLHPDVLITKDLIHFFRFIYKKYDPIKNKQNLFKLVGELCLRLKFRQKIILNKNQLFKTIVKKKITYRNIYIEISKYILNQTGKKIFGENANSEWKNISTFLKLDKNFKAYQGIRDPRAVLMSWKNLTYEPGNKYLIILFNWLDAIQEMEKNLNKFKKRFTYIRFEDIHNNPHKTISKLYCFLGLKFKKDYLILSNFNKQKKNPFIHINVSGYSNKQVIGFSKKRTSNWKKKIQPWEVALTQHLLGKYMEKYGYKLNRIDSKDLKLGLKKINYDPLLKKLYAKYRKTGKGTFERLSDPSKPENWSATDTSKNIKLKFIETPDYLNYMKELKIIQTQAKKI